MKIVEPHARMIGDNIGYNGEFEDFPLDRGITLLRKIERHARKSHMSMDRMTATSYDRFLRFVVLEKGDWSVVEHASVSIEMNDDRGIQQEITRHRIASYTIESTRFVNYSKPGQAARFIYPRFQDSEPHPAWFHAVKTCEESYIELLKDGWTPQEARSVFPLALDSNIDVTENLRSWRHFFIMRTTKEAHPQMKRFAIPLLQQFQAKIPILFEDIEPLKTQKHNLGLGR
jgi:thymidylate synthase (FAD)